MHLAYTNLPGRGALDALMAEAAASAAGAGLRLCGAVQADLAFAPGQERAMFLRLVPGGDTVLISQRLGALAQGCALDPEGLEQAALMVSRLLARGADALILNKFGKQEAEGRGFRGVIAEALEREIPVLVGVREAQMPAFLDFAGGLAQPLPPDAERLAAWLAAPTPAEPQPEPPAEPPAEPAAAG